MWCNRGWPRLPALSSAWQMFVPEASRPHARLAQLRRCPARPATPAAARRRRRRLRARAGAHAAPQRRQRKPRMPALVAAVVAARRAGAWQTEAWAPRLQIGGAGAAAARRLRLRGALAEQGGRQPRRCCSSPSSSTSCPLKVRVCVCAVWVGVGVSVGMRQDGWVGVGRRAAVCCCSPLFTLLLPREVKRGREECSAEVLPGVTRLQQGALFVYSWELRASMAVGFCCPGAALCSYFYAPRRGEVPKGRGKGGGGPVEACPVLMCARMCLAVQSPPHSSARLACQGQVFVRVGSSSWWAPAWRRSRCACGLRPGARARQRMQAHASTPIHTHACADELTYTRVTLCADAHQAYATHTAKPAALAAGRPLLGSRC